MTATSLGASLPLPVPVPVIIGDWLPGPEQGCRRRGFQLLVFWVSRKSLLLLPLLSSIVELGTASWATFLGFRVTFCYIWPVGGSVRSLRDRTVGVRQALLASEGGSLGQRGASTKGS